MTSPPDGRPHTHLDQQRRPRGVCAGCDDQWRRQDELVALAVTETAATPPSPRPADVRRALARRLAAAERRRAIDRELRVLRAEPGPPPAGPAVCTCEPPSPRHVLLFDALELADVIECARCGRPIYPEAGLHRDPDVGG
jgi:hypothetical protein